MPERRPVRFHPAGGPDDLDRLVDRFESAWQSGAPPDIEEFLQAGRAVARPLLHELVKIDLEYRWRRPNHGAAGQNTEGPSPARPRLEFYVKRIPRLGPLQQLPVDLIGEEYRVRQCWGDRPAHAEYAARFPGRGAALRTALERVDAELHAEMATDCVRAVSKPGAASRPKSLSGIAQFLCAHCGQAVEAVAALASPNPACPVCCGSFGVGPLSTFPSRNAQPPSRKVGRYELGDLLGTGAFGSVWQAWDGVLGRQVAVKLPRSGPFWGSKEEERFLREARAAGQLHHPGIVAVHDVGRAEESLFIVSELVRGENLAERLRRERLSFQAAAAMAAHVADALDYAHRQGVVHRDVKPSNIMLGRDEFPAGKDSLALGGRRPLLMDFGMALDITAEVAMTLDGQVLGTPAYMSPEQIRNPHAVDGRSDIYSMGVILYELLTGELPFRGSARVLLARAASEGPRPPRQLNDGVPRDLETICLKCLAKEPARRYPTAGALAVDLRRWLTGEPIFARPVGRAERVWLWGKRNRVLAVTGGLGAAALAVVTGAPVTAALVAVAAGSLLFALHKTKAASELGQAVEDMKRHQQKTAAALKFAARHCTLAREDQQRAVAAEARARRQLVPGRELARAVLFDLPENLKDSPHMAAARAFLIHTVLTYVGSLEQEAVGDGPLLRELAIVYAKISDLQRSATGGTAGNLVGALASHRKSLEIFGTLARALPDNAQAQRDLAVSAEKAADLEHALSRGYRGRNGEN
jgi:Protein kinase domain